MIAPGLTNLCSTLPTAGVTAGVAPAGHVNCRLAGRADAEAAVVGSADGVMDPAVALAGIWLVPALPQAVTMSPVIRAMPVVRLARLRTISSSALMLRNRRISYVTVAIAR